jgi:hypothetical protein
VGVTPTPLPYAVTTGFFPSGYTGGDPATSGNGQIMQPVCAAGDRAPGAIGACKGFTYAGTTNPTWAGVAFLTGAGFGQPGKLVCLASGANKVTFYAKGKDGGEVVTFTAQSGTETLVTLTTAWVKYEIAVAPGYSTDDAGVVEGFFWKIAP